MAFITGVDLEGRFAQEDTLALLKKHPPRRRRKQLELEDVGWQAVALCNEEEKPPDALHLLHSAAALADDEDPLEDLRRRIKRTRAKMDSQTKVMNGFLHDVRQMQQMDRSFSSSELSALSSPSGQPKMLTGAKSYQAIGDSSATVQRTRGAPALGNYKTPAMSRNSSLRSGGGIDRHRALLGGSQSQPHLGSLHQAAPIVVPPRRAPPGGACSETHRVVASASAARRNAAAVLGNLGAGRKAAVLNHTPAFV